MYSMLKIMCFLISNHIKHIALHQIHKIMLFLATAYDPFKLQVGESPILPSACTREDTKRHISNSISGMITRVNMRVLMV